MTVDHATVSRMLAVSAPVRTPVCRMMQATVGWPSGHG
jgi:hypothetical protein